MTSTAEHTLKERELLRNVNEFESFLIFSVMNRSPATERMTSVRANGVEKNTGVAERSEWRYSRHRGTTLLASLR